MSIRPAVLIMFRDEGDILERCLNHWYGLGVRSFYLCDNGSVDESQNRCIDFQFAHDFSDDSGNNFVLTTNLATDWPGRRVINSLKERAIDDGCNWIFPADADEFLQLPNGLNIFEWIKSLGTVSGWGEIPYLNIMPDGSSNWQEPQRKCFGVITKDMTISMGNHIVEETGATIKAHGVYYKHFSMRSYPQFKKKMENYMTAFSQTQFHDHHHSIDFKLWQDQGEGFLVRKWRELTGMDV